MNRPYLGAGEIRQMLTTENIIGYYNQREASGDWDEWAKKNEHQSIALNNAMIAAAKRGLLDA